MNEIKINGHVIERGQVWLTIAGHVAIITRTDFPHRDNPIEGIIHITDNLNDELDTARAGFYHWNANGEDRIGETVPAEDWSLERPLLNFEVRHLRMSQCYNTKAQHPSIQKVEWLQECDEGEINRGD